MSNVHRHAAATSVVVDLRLTPAEVILSVGNNGRGMQARPAGSNGSKPSLGVGIPGMRIRLYQFGGTLRLQTSSRGSLVRARVPSPAHLQRDRQPRIAIAVGQYRGDFRTLPREFRGFSWFSVPCSGEYE
jgi:signal transduction histidine kinase